VVPGRRTDDAAGALLVGEQRQLVERPAELVRAGALENLGLEPDVEAGALAERGGGEQRRVARVLRNTLASLLEPFGWNGDRRPPSN